MYFDVCNGRDSGRKVEDPDLLESIRLTIINNLLKYHPVCILNNLTHIDYLSFILSDVDLSLNFLNISFYFLYLSFLVSW